MVTINDKLVEGYWNITPELKAIDFPTNDSLRVELVDGLHEA